MEKLTIIKIGGNVIDNSEHLHKFLESFSALEGNKILVHGGGKIATKIADDLGYETQMVKGRRVTDINSLQVVTMVYAGLINKNMVAQLQFHGCNAIGLTGADGNFIRTKKRPIVKVSPTGGDLERVDIDYGYVGDIYETSVASHNISNVIKAGFIPVFCAITHDGNSQLLNTNADTIASALAVSLANIYDTTLVYCFEKNGVLRNIEDENSVITEIDENYYQELKADEIIFEGMIPKLDNAFDAINKGVTAVYIGKADDLAQLNSGGFGTKMLK